MDQADLAGALGLHWTAVSHWENGALPGVPSLLKLASVLNTTVAELIEGEKAYAALAQMLRDQAA